MWAPTTVGGVLAVLLLAAPVSGQKIASGYVEQFDLGGLRTFQFLQQDRKLPDALAEDTESEQFIRQRLTEALVAAGFQPAESNPDFAIAYYAKTYLRSSYRVLGFKTTGTDLALGRDNYDMGVLIVDFVSPKLNQAVWRGRADKAINQKNAPKVITQVCTKLVSQFEKDARQQAKKRKR